MHRTCQSGDCTIIGHKTFLLTAEYPGTNIAAFCSPKRHDARVESRPPLTAETGLPAFVSAKHAYSPGLCRRPGMCFGGCAGYISSCLVPLKAINPLPALSIAWHLGLLRLKHTLF